MRRGWVAALLAASPALVAGCGGGGTHEAEVMLIAAPEAVASPAASPTAGAATPSRDQTELLERAPAAVREVARAIVAEPTPAPAVPPVSRGIPAPEVRASAAVVIDEASGAILYALDAHRPLPPASLTKIATAVTVLEAGGLDDEVDTEPDILRHLRLDSTSMGLEPGDRFTVRELLHGLLIASGNDAAEELAEHEAGSQEGLVARMNALVARLGLQSTHFTDTHGLGGPGHYSSAYDMAMLARFAMTFPLFREIVAHEEYVARGSRELELLNPNPLLGYTEGVDGVKTGYTEEAGRTYVASVTRGGHRVYVVLFNAQTRASDAIALIEWTFANHEWR
jgi:D-alanyl-D-alanine carboxypeptidase